MSLFIQTDAGGTGSGGGIHVDSVQAHLIQISNGDLNVGFNNPTTPPDLMQVTYGTQTTTGPCPTRLHTLVNTQFNVNPQHIDIIVVGVDSSFVTLDGTMITSAAGITAPVGNVDNPTASVLVIYDTSQANGTGYCVREQGHSDFALEFPGSAILYHELSHAFRDAMHTSLSQAASGCDASPEEMAAEVDENDMRTQLGVGLRDTSNHCGNAGCPSNCCIVASIATGSGYSTEVNALRHLRDNFLRRSEVGHVFFDELFREYYGFSPEICRMMGGNTGLKRMIEWFFVEPLTLSLELIRNYTVERVDAETLGTMFFEGLSRVPILRDLTAERLASVRQVVNAMRNGEAPAVPEWEQITSFMLKRGASSRSVRWALMDTVELYVQALEWRQAGFGSQAIGERLAAAIDAWSAELPISDLWTRLSRYDVRQELAFLEQSLLRSPVARKRFAGRLREEFPSERRLQEVLSELSEEVMQ